METQNEKFKSSNISKYVFEISTWVFISILYQLEGIIWAIRRSNSISTFFVDYINDFSFKLVIGIVIILFPILFKLIFGFFPLSLLKNLLNERLKSNNNPNQSLTTIKKAENIDPEKPLDYLQRLCHESEKIANNIYTRSNVYLLVGTSIAIIGILFFSLQSSNYSIDNFDYTNSDFIQLETMINALEKAGVKNSENLDMLLEKYFFENFEKKSTAGYSTYLISFVPRFGALFFIEFIAFFFLKQYRNSMDEYKFYESVKRNRQEVLFKINLMESKGDVKNVSELIDLMNFSSNPDILNSSQTSELIEKRKLSKDEIGIMDKIVDSIVKLKG